MSDALVAFDPGLDDIGWSRFAPLPRGVIDPLSIRRAYRASGLEHVSDPTSGTVHRLALLAEIATRVLVSDGGTARCIIELPARAGSYRARLEHQRTQQAVNSNAMTLLYLAVGSLVQVGLACGCAVELRPASAKSKLERLAIVASYWPQFRSRVFVKGGKKSPKGSPRPDDETDAVYLGLQATMVGSPAGRL